MANLCKEKGETHEERHVFQHKMRHHRRCETRRFTDSVPFTLCRPHLWRWHAGSCGLHRLKMGVDSTYHPGLSFRHFILLGSFGGIQLRNWYHIMKYLILYLISNSSTVYHVNVMARPCLQEAPWNHSLICPLQAKLLEAETCRDIHPWAGCEPDVCNKNTSGMLESFAWFFQSHVCWCFGVKSLLTSIKMLAPEICRIIEPGTWPESKFQRIQVWKWMETESWDIFDHRSSW